VNFRLCGDAIGQRHESNLIPLCDEFWCQSVQIGHMQTFSLAVGNQIATEMIVV
jgi:hypothetical protein